jgi:hypothetical protein
MGLRMRSGEAVARSAPGPEGMDQSHRLLVHQDGADDPGMAQMMSTDTPAAANSAGNQRGRPFPKGQSGNPAGKPIGTRHRATLAIQALLDGEAEALTRKAIELALAGDVACLRMCIDRIAPAPRARTVELDLPSVGARSWNVAESTIEALGKIATAAADGTITPSEAVELVAVVEALRASVKDMRPGRLDAEPTPEQRAAERHRADQLHASFDKIGLGRF